MGTVTGTPSFSADPPRQENQQIPTAVASTRQEVSCVYSCVYMCLREWTSARPYQTIFASRPLTEERVGRRANPIHHGSKQNQRFSPPMMCYQPSMCSLCIFDASL